MRSPKRTSLDPAPIDLETETPISIKDVPEYVESLTGHRPGIATVWRWRLKGVRGQKLPVVMAGNRAFTTQEALQRFFAAIDAAQRGEPAPVRTSKQRAKAVAKAEKELADAGI